MFRGIVRGIAKNQVLNGITTNIRQLSRQNIIEWLDGRRSVLALAQSQYTDSIRQHKDSASEVLNTITVEEIRNACIRGNPDCRDLFTSPQFDIRVNEELANARRFVESL